MPIPIGTACRDERETRFPAGGNDVVFRRRETRNCRAAGKRTKFRMRGIFRTPLGFRRSFGPAFLHGETPVSPTPFPFNSRHNLEPNENSSDKRSCFHLVGPPGIEPGLYAPEAHVLPVYYGPKLMRRCTSEACASPTKRGTMAIKQPSGPPSFARPLKRKFPFLSRANLF